MRDWGKKNKIKKRINSSFETVLIPWSLHIVETVLVGNVSEVVGSQLACLSLYQTEFVGTCCSVWFLWTLNNLGLCLWFDDPSLRMVSRQMCEDLVEWWGAETFNIDFQGQMSCWWWCTGKWSMKSLLHTSWLLTSYQGWVSRPGCEKEALDNLHSLWDWAAQWGVEEMSWVEETYSGQGCKSGGLLTIQLFQPKT